MPNTGLIGIVVAGTPFVISGNNARLLARRLRDSGPSGPAHAAAARIEAILAQLDDRARRGGPLLLSTVPDASELHAIAATVRTWKLTGSVPLQVSQLAAAIPSA